MNGGEAARVKAPLAHFLDVYLEDCTRGSVRPLAEYLLLIPGDDAGITREYARRAPEREAEEPPAEEFVVNVGSHIDDYRIVSRIGAGRLGPTYEAVDLRTDLRVAIKVLTGSGAASPTLLKRFLHDAAVVAELEHPGVAHVLDTGQLSGIPYIVTEFVGGSSLDERLRLSQEAGHEKLRIGTDLPSPRAATSGGSAGLEGSFVRVLSFVEEIARALHVVHEAGVIHMNLSPERIIVTPQGTPVILGFGLAQDVGDTALPKTGDFGGNPEYMAPERFTERIQKIDRRADVWSLGILLHECMSLRCPFTGDTPQRVMRAIRAQPTPQTAFAAGAPGLQLGSIVGVALQKVANERYATVLDLADDVRRLRAGTFDRPVLRVSDPQPEPCAESTESTEVVKSPEVVERKGIVEIVRARPTRRRSHWNRTVAGVVVVTVLFAGWFFGLTTVEVTSLTSGSRIIVDGVDTGLRTPARLPRWTVLTGDIRFEVDPPATREKPSEGPSKKLPVKGPAGPGKSAANPGVATRPTVVDTKPSVVPVKQPDAPEVTTRPIPDERESATETKGPDEIPPVKVPAPPVRDTETKPPPPVPPKVGVLTVAAARSGVVMRLSLISGVGDGEQTFALPLAEGIPLAPGRYRAALSGSGLFSRTRIFGVRVGETVTLNAGLQSRRRAHFAVEGDFLTGVTHRDLDRDGWPDFVMTTGGRVGEVPYREVQVVRGRDGTLLWSRRFVQAERLAVLLSGATAAGEMSVLVVATVARGKMPRMEAHTLAGASGQRIGGWNRPAEPWRNGTFADIDGDGQDEFLAVSGSSLSAHRTENGALIWRTEASLPPGSGPVTCDLDGSGKLDVLLCDHRGRLLVLEGSTGKPKVTFESGHRIIEGPVLVTRESNVVAVILDENGTLSAVDPRTGTLVGAPLAVGGSAAIARAQADFDGDGVLDLVLGTEKGSVIAVSGADLVLLWKSSEGGGLLNVFPSAFPDMDGDSCPDVLCGSAASRDGTSEGVLAAFSGRDGTVLMREGMEGIVPGTFHLLDMHGDGELEILAGVSGGADRAARPGISLIRLRPGPERWRFGTGGAATSCIIARDLDSNGSLEVVFGTADGRVYALSGAGGDPLWRVAVGGSICGAPAFGDLDGDSVLDVVVATEGGRIHVISGRTGQILGTSMSVKGPLLSGPVVAEVTGEGRPEVVISARDGSVRVFSSDGTEIKRFLSASDTGRADFRAAPAVGDLNGDGVAEIVAGCLDGHVYAWSVKTEGFSWKHRVGTPVLSTPVVANVDGKAGVEVVALGSGGGLVVLAGTDGRRLSLRAVTRKGSRSEAPGSTTWFLHDLDGDGRRELVYGGRNGRLRCSSAQTGVLEWQASCGTGGFPRAVAIPRRHADGALVVTTPGGGQVIRVLAGNDGEMLWEHDVGAAIASAPASADLDGDGDQEILVSTTGGGVIALALGEPALRVPIRIARADRARQDATVEELIGAAPELSAEWRVPLISALSRMGRHEEATRRMEETVASGFRSPRLGALHLLYMVRAGQSLDWNLLATCVRAGPERFLLAIAGHAHLLQGAGPGRFHNAMILLIARLNRTGARDLLAREAVRLLMGGRPERDRWGVFSDDPVGADLFRVFSALSAMADEARRRRVTTELKAATITGKRFAQAWSTLPSRTRELLRAFRSSR